SVERPSTHLFAAWLTAYLDVPSVVEADPEATAITGVDLELADGVISMLRPEGSSVVTINQPGQPEHQIATPKRPLEDCSREALRGVEPDGGYRRGLVGGLSRVQVVSAEVARWAALSALWWCTRTRTPWRVRLRPGSCLRWRMRSRCATRCTWRSLAARSAPR